MGASAAAVAGGKTVWLRLAVGAAAASATSVAESIGAVGFLYEALVSTSKRIRRLARRPPTVASSRVCRRASTDGDSELHLELHKLCDLQAVR